MSDVKPMGSAIVYNKGTGRIKYDVMPTRERRLRDYETYRRATGKEPEGILVAGEAINFPAG